MKKVILGLLTILMVCSCVEKKESGAKAGTSKMSDLLEAQLLYQQSLDRRTDAYADYQNKLLEYRQSTGQKVE